MRTHTRRPAITLIEVLAAIFIMGVGMLAILTLFPLGAINMARALRDDRTGHIAHNAGSLAIAKDLHSFSDLVNRGVVEHMTLQPANFAAGGYLPPDPGGVSYPVFVDPYYALSFPQLSNALFPVHRVAAPYATTPYLLERFFTLQDDLTFFPDGRPQASGNLERQGYYSWTYMFRRSITSLPATTEMFVIVYSGRPNLVPQQEPFFDVDLTPTGNPPAVGNTSIILNRTSQVPGPAAGGILPGLRRGYWLFDITYTPVPPVVANQPPQYGRVHGHFYRVIEATRINNDQVQVEIEPPLRSGAPAQGLRMIMVSLENAVEVFERGTAR